MSNKQSLACFLLVKPAVRQAPADEASAVGGVTP